MCICTLMFFLPVYLYMIFIGFVLSIMSPHMVCMHLLNNCSRNGDDGRSSCYHTVKSLITLNFVVQE